MNKISQRKVSAAIRKHKSFLITTHTSPEGDALGSELGLYFLLKKMNKRVFIVNQDPLPQELSFLPGADCIKLYKENNKISFDCMVALDCSHLSRAGDVYKLNSKSRPVINIDHHISNNNFGDYNWVEPHLSSASEMVYLLYKEMGIAFDRKSALSLYVGIMTDTGSFRYSNTSELTHRAAAEFMRLGLDINMVYRDIYENVSFPDMQLLIKILSGVVRAKNGKVVYVSVPAGLLKHRKVSFDLSEHILGFMRAIKDAQVAVLFKENIGVKNEIRFNLRSNGSFDVNKIAQYFGGGGHKNASGCTIKGRLADIRRKVISRIIKSLK
ncbi:MAG: Bifunctional oligoribonuclease and PAP phosphatase NrnA [Candidatus Omnitrophica bacterium ADurb.Bin205]|nr:MAG: Bifunctional oligoribonuclease and PAP phosphatase NrnA [Candidatus Omnitrophica bacterium ADurb.Bin205]